ncbi:HU family DNA-binding protein [Buchnera aphidicola (Neophyllaphis podocarpi)]|uniref:HU family DNA-binding protein n=1 Tax=Buchnera aphidicola TaxID=9 RepID=UPI0031B89E73
MLLTKSKISEYLFITLGINKNEAKELVFIFFKELSSALIDHKNVKLLGFGKFNILNKKQIVCRNFKTNQSIKIKSYISISFKSSKKLKNNIKKYLIKI